MNKYIIIYPDFTFEETTLPIGKVYPIPHTSFLFTPDKRWAYRGTTYGHSKVNPNLFWLMCKPTDVPPEARAIVMLLT